MPVAPDDVVKVLTWARTQPKEAASVLRERLVHYKGKDYFPPEREGGSVVTKEGRAVVEEAIAYLQGLEPMEGLGAASDPALGVAAEDHVADIGLTGAVSHSSSDSTSAGDRVGRYGTFRSTGESLWYGSALADARTMVLDLIVDDGVASRGHRLCVLNPIWECVGVACGSHATFGTMAALEFAKGWKPDEAAVEARLAAGPVKVEGQDEAKKGVRTQWALGSCLVCGEEIRGGAVVEIDKLHARVHKDCFKCSECSKALRGVPWNIHEQTIFCKTCYAAKHGEKCTACGKPIEGAMMRCSLGQFHVECIVCSICKKAIGKGTFSTASGAISCQACASQRSRANSVGKVSGLLGDGSPDRERRPSAGGLAAVGRTASPAPVAKAVPATKAKAKAKAKTTHGKVSLAAAGAGVVGLGMDYSSLG